MTTVPADRTLMRHLPNGPGMSIPIKRMRQGVDERVTAIQPRTHPWIRSKLAEHVPGEPLSASPFELPAG